jgi:hypothetical protein
LMYPTLAALARGILEEEVGTLGVIRACVR